ncbi:unnamed protein product [Paramecium sonneborni]|uniref:Uncharacterized protein n=1 Tax=Paramecium sonneborni TaxID=65129 RepID=A0A8S1RES8_9CILI|nr:unnamed protein product [Paramecium sonneborni]
MNAQKFYYGEDIIEKSKEYQFVIQTNKSFGPQSEKERIIRQITKNPTQPNLRSQNRDQKNITEQNSDQIGVEKLHKKRTFLLQKQPQQQDYSEDLLTSKMKVIKVPFKKIHTSCENIPIKNQKTHSHMNSLDQEKQFLKALFSKDIKKDEKVVRLRLNRSQLQLHTQTQNSEISLEKGLKYTTQSSFRRESQKELKDKKQTEYKQYSFKQVLAYDYMIQIYRKQNALENLLNNVKQFVGFMNLTFNLTNLPLNINGLEQMFKTPKYLLKTLKPFIPQSLEKLLFEDFECQKFRQLTLQFQLFYILFYQSELIDIVTNSPVKFIIRQPKDCQELYHQIEKILLNQNVHQQDFQIIQQLFEKQYNQPYEQLLNEAKSNYKLQIEYEYVKHLYCFCIKVQEALSQKILHEGKKNQIYDKGFDFKTALKKIKCKEINHDNLFIENMLNQLILNTTNFMKRFLTYKNKLIELLYSNTNQHFQVIYVSIFDLILNMFKRLPIINPGCDTIFNDQETNENLNFLTQPIKKIFLSNELTIPQIFSKSNLQTPQTKQISLNNSEQKSFQKFQSQFTNENDTSIQISQYKSNIQILKQGYIQLISYIYIIVYYIIIQIQISYSKYQNPNKFYQIQYIIIGFKKISLVIVGKVNVQNYIVIVLLQENYVLQNAIVVDASIIVLIYMNEILILKQ